MARTKAGRLTVLRALFVVGLGLMALGWMFDRVTAFPWLLRWIASSDNIAARDALQALQGNAKLGILPGNPGFTPLLHRWPHLAAAARVRIIGRSVAFTEFSPDTVTNDFELIPYASQTEKLEPIWSAAAARSVIQGSIDRQVFDVSRAVFLIGLVVAAVTGWPG